MFTSKVDPRLLESIFMFSNKDKKGIKWVKKEWKIKKIFSYRTSDSPKKLQIPGNVKQFLWLWLEEWKTFSMFTGNKG